MKNNVNDSFKNNASFRLSMSYLIKSFALFCTLIFIALFVRDSFIRPIGGDILVVIWLYYSFASFIDMQKKWLIGLVLSIAYLVEFGQLIKFNDWIGIEPSSTLSVIFGATFDWLDIVAYTVGAGICYWLDKRNI
ncbi:TPA: DUF2809 domain-containing protein [Photobacterium damselae]